MVNSRNVAIVIFDDVEVLDFAGPFEVFNVASEVIPFDPYPAFYTYTVGLTGQPIVARGGLRVTPHFSLETCPQPDILLVPGGFGVRRLLKNDHFLRWLEGQYAQVEKMLSVCTGALTLGQIGLLRDLEATTHHGAFALLRELSPSTTVVADQRYVVNAGGKLITSGGISAGIDMSLAVVEMLLGAEKLALVVEEMEWGWNPAS
jgi:transcriptional regulator GlxA family with amidase domain